VVYVKGISESLCGAMRPGHFDGVCTIVSKLFMQVLPDVAFFGEKDYQQLQVIRRMVWDLDIPVMVRNCQIIREPDGLAMSSRNAYLNPDERQIAPMLYKTLTRVSNKLLENMTQAHVALDWGIQQLQLAGFKRVDYLELRDAETLLPVDEIRRPARLLVAAHLGRTRLIDNLAVLP
jgi:pantoate--beta-alanine ligase